MSDDLDGVLLSPEDEAGRLWKGALKALENASECITDLSEAVDLGARAVEIMVSQRLQAVRGKFRPPSPALLICCR